MKNILPVIIAVISISFFVGACSPMVDTRGNLPNPKQLAKIQPGLQTRNDVLTILGSPSTSNIFDDTEVWYYISSTQERMAFYELEEVERKIIKITFNKEGKVKSVDNKGIEDGMNVEITNKVTPTAGHSVGLVRQLIGNIGRFENSNEGKK